MGELHHVARLVAETPWAIRPQVLSVIVELVGMRARGERLSDADVRDRLEAAAAARPGRDAPAPAPGVAVLPLRGVLFPRANLVTEMSGGTSLEMWRADLAQAVGSSEVAAIVLDVDSPGGMVDLVPETAAVVRAARDVKPVVAVANTDAASAAYWLASQASELVVTPSGMVGSIGVLTAHEDMSGMLEQAGVKTTLIHAGRFKVEGNPYEPLGDEARDAIQEMVDEFYAMFVADAAAGRGASVSDVRSGFGEGRMVTAARAVELGMADRVGTLADAVGRAAQLAQTPRGRSALGGALTISATESLLYPAPLTVSTATATANADTEAAAAVEPAADEPAPETPDNPETNTGPPMRVRHARRRLRLHELEHAPEH